MELFSEINNCYYQVLRHLLNQSVSLSLPEMRELIAQEGFEESLLAILPKIETKTWNLFEKEGFLYSSKLKHPLSVPLTDLQKSYLKALLSDIRIRLFFSSEQLSDLQTLLFDTAPLWLPEQFYCYDSVR